MTLSIGVGGNSIFQTSTHSWLVISIIITSSISISNAIIIIIISSSSISISISIIILLDSRHANF